METSMETLFFEITDKRNCDMVYECGQLTGTYEEIIEHIKALSQFYYETTGKENEIRIY